MLLVLWKKWFPSRDAERRSEDGFPERAVAAIQAGDEALRNELLAKYKPYMAKTASRFSRRFIDPERDDEFSVALAAFNEAITSYSPDGGSRFLSFAEKVIRRRLIDYVRQEVRHTSTVPYSSVAEETDDGRDQLNRIETAQAMAVYEQARETESRQSEIVALSEELERYGIRFEELAEQSPKHHDSRQNVLQLGVILAESEAMFRILANKKLLPVKELCEIGNVSRKTVERHRKYIIAVALIAKGSFPFLQEYIGFQRKRGSEA